MGSSPPGGFPVWSCQSPVIGPWDCGHPRGGQRGPVQRMLFPLTPLHRMQRGDCCPFSTFCKCVLNPDFLIYIKNAFS